MSLRLALDVDAPFALAPLRGFLAAHAVTGLEVHDPRTGAHTRPVRVGGQVVVVTAHLGGLVDGRLVVHAEGAGELSLAGRLRPLLRRWLDLDAPVGAVDAQLARDPLLAPLVTARPGLRVPGSLDPFETAVLAVLGQQVSLGAARTFAARLVAGLGSPVDATPAGGGDLRLPPDPVALLEAGAAGVREVTGVTGARAASLVALAAAAQDGLDLSAADELLQLPGIGPWTVGYVQMRAFRDADAFLAGDLVLRRALGARRPAEATARAERWRPFRAYAALHLWTDAVPALQGTTGASATTEPVEPVGRQPSTASTRPTARRASGSGR